MRCAPKTYMLIERARARTVNAFNVAGRVAACRRSERVDAICKREFLGQVCVMRFSLLQRAQPQMRCARWKVQSPSVAIWTVRKLRERVLLNMHTLQHCAASRLSIYPARKHLQYYIVCVACSAQLNHAIEMCAATAASSSSASSRRKCFSGFVTYIFASLRAAASTTTVVSQCV